MKRLWTENQLDAKCEEFERTTGIPMTDCTCLGCKAAPYCESAWSGSGGRGFCADLDFYIRCLNWLKGN